MRREAEWSNRKLAHLIGARGKNVFFLHTAGANIGDGFCVSAPVGMGLRIYGL